jgi:hypothetical protein
MKRFLALLLALVMCASMAACSETPAEPTTEATVATEPETFSVFAFNALIDGKPVAELTEKTTVTATAEPEEGFVVDYWKINGVPYRYGSTVTYMVVKNLDEATEFEVVVKEKPITYYHVTCTGCTVNGKTDLWVAAGTTVTATANNGYSEFEINGVWMNDRWSGAKSWTFTVTGDTTVKAYTIVN